MWRQIGGCFLTTRENLKLEFLNPTPMDLLSLVAIAIVYVMVY
jgi:hypothetical protein